MTMEAPEKIYMTPSFGEPDNVLLASFSKSHLDFHRDIEYTRTDFFIDKACAFIRERLNFDDAWFVLIKDKVIKDFKNYMKGE